MARMYVATRSFITTGWAGGRINATKGRTLVSEDDELYRRYPQYFRPAEDQLRGVEQATAAPGEERDIQIGDAKAEAKASAKK